jgi:hypothetical protein
MAIRSGLLIDSRFIFEPVDLGGQAADLAVELIRLALLFDLLISLAFGIPLEKFR